VSLLLVITLGEVRKLPGLGFQRAPRLPELRDRREQLLKAAYYEVIRDEAKVENFFAEDILKKTGATK